MIGEALKVTGLFAVAAALVLLASAVHVHGKNGRYHLADNRGLIFDTATGEVFACTGKPLTALDAAVTDTLDCKTVIAARR